jgi:hypothetical protein
MSKNEGTKIATKEVVWESKGIIGNYVNLCISGLGTGALVGGYVGATIGFTTAVTSPGILMYGLFRTAKKFLRR